MQSVAPRLARSVHALRLGDSPAEVIARAKACVLARLNLEMTFIYVSGVGTHETEQARSMWARVKGRTENVLRGLSFRGIYLFRPAAILPANGERSGTEALRYSYAATELLLLCTNFPGVTF